MKLGQHIDGLVQEKGNSIANTLELRLSCTKPSMCTLEQDTSLNTELVSSTALIFLDTNLWVSFTSEWRREVNLTPLLFAHELCALIQLGSKVKDIDMASSDNWK